jgi:hypothetical protein
MSDTKLRLTFEQIGFIMEQTGIKDPKEAMIYFAEVMKMEGLKPRQMPEVVTKMMERMRRQKK